MRNKDMSFVDSLEPGSPVFILSTGGLYGDELKLAKVLKVYKQHVLVENSYGQEVKFRKDSGQRAGERGYGGWSYMVPYSPENIAKHEVEELVRQITSATCALDNEFSQSKLRVYRLRGDDLVPDLTSARDNLKAAYATLRRILPKEEKD